VDEWGDTTRFVRELASERGVSERTVWRWAAAAKATDALQFPTQAKRCQACDKILPKGTLRRRYCEDACRARARRARLVQVHGTE
jgi:hypothetical protein